MKSTLQNLKLVALAIILTFGLSFAYAWVAPTQAPPNGNADEPITTRGGQTIKGNLTIGEPASPGTLNITRLAVLDGTGTPVSPSTGQVLSFRTPTQVNPANVEWVTGGGGGGGGGTPAPTITFGASSTNVPYAGSSTLTWSTTNATSCVGSGGASSSWPGPKTLSDTQALASLTTSAPYTLTCTGPGGSAAEIVTINVNAPIAPPAVTFGIATTPDASGNASLRWSGTGIITSCQALGAWWAGTRPTTSGATPEVVRGITTSTRDYLFSCTGPGGTTLRTVTMPAARVPSATINAYVSRRTGCGRSYCDYNYAVVTWSSSNSASCAVPSGSELYAGVPVMAFVWTGAKTLSGTQEIQFGTMRKWDGAGEGHTFTLTCTGAGGSGTASYFLQF